MEGTAMVFGRWLWDLGVRVFGVNILKALKL
jgi:hypothetical protein